MPFASLSPDAEDDLGEIHAYIAEDNPSIADSFILEFFEKFKMLAVNPFLGRARDEIAPGIRYFPFRRYLIFYFPTDYGVEIWRVLHSARDIESLFNE